MSIVKGVVSVLLALAVVPYVMVRNTYRHWRYGCRCEPKCWGYR